MWNESEMRSLSSEEKKPVRDAMFWENDERMKQKYIIVDVMSLSRAQN